MKKLTLLFLLVASCASAQIGFQGIAFGAVAYKEIVASPTIPTDGLVCKFLAENYASGTWTDASGNGNTASTTGTSSNWPTKIGSYVYFDGSDNVTVASLSSQTVASVSTQIVLFDVNDTSSDNSCLFDSTTSYEIVARYDTGGNYKLYSGAFSTIGAAPGQTWSAPKLGFYSFGLTPKVRHNNYVYTGLTTSGAHIPGSGLVIGEYYNYDAGNGFKGKIYCYLSYNRQLSTWEEDQIRDYLVYHYGVTLD